ncbi:9230_t:CDS:10 [Acaulospora colombiana]|uniref:9230_t:CDS:1 n=1 Tax=Acaulospora colombiana TaxID=27376 RepID=A0ACA9MVV0_9GLOM|nr:9230_t:CDS:10 [Acaulospora colombiana]
MACRALLRLNSNAARSLTTRTHVIGQNRAFTSVSATRLLRNTQPLSCNIRQRAASTTAEEFDIDAEVPPAKPQESTPVDPFGDSNPLPTASDESGTDWSRSFQGLSASPFPKEISDILLAPIDPADIEIKPGQAQIKYRRILNRAFGPGGWGLAPRGGTNASAKVVSREYALVCLGRLVAVARGEQEYFDPSGVATASESCKSNALMRCCKDLGIARTLALSVNSKLSTVWRFSLSMSRPRENGSSGDLGTCHMSYQVALLTGCVKSPLLDVFVLLMTETKHKSAIPRPPMPHKTKVALIYLKPYDKDAIASAILDWTGKGDIDLILTTGGTGFGQRDVTPELILSTSPRAVLSRPVSGVRGKTLIITLPGSLKAVKECLGALTQGDTLDHALSLLRGANSRALHEQSQHAGEGTLSTHLPRELHSGCGHDHGPKARTQDDHDKSSALDLIATHLSPLPPVLSKVESSLRGTVIAEPIHGDKNIPILASSNVDGYALQGSYSTFSIILVLMRGSASQVAGMYNVLHAGSHDIDKPLPEGYIYRINTGAPLPTGTNAVIMVEDTRLVSKVGPDERDDNEADEERQVETMATIDPGENVRQAGSDLRKGEKIFEKGDIIGNTGGDIGALAFVGQREILVVKKPTVAILSTGNELLDLHAQSNDEGAKWSGWDTNRPTLKGVLEAMGYSVIDLGIIKDSMAAHEQALKKGLENADIILTTGGSSMGTTDVLKPVIEQRLKGKIVFGRVKVKPGKPTVFAQLPHEKDSWKPLFGLPGNPASALVTQNKAFLQRVKVKLADTMLLDPRPEFHRVRIQVDSQGMLVAYSTGGQRSSRATSLNGANGLVAIPAKEEGGPERIAAGEMADALLIDF